MTYSEFSRQELSIGICMGPLCGGGGGGPPGGSEFLGGGLQKILGHFYGILNILSEFLAQTQSISSLFEQSGLRGGAVDMSKSQRHTRSGAGRGESRANEAAINEPQTYRIVPA